MSEPSDVTSIFIHHQTPNVDVDRGFLAGFGIVALRDVIGLRRLKLDALLTSDDICKLPVQWTFSISREVLTERFQQMLEEFVF
jgi:hypothetical protein